MEIEILKAFEKIYNPVFDTIAIIMAKLGNGGMIFIAIGVLFLFFKKTRTMGITILLSLIVSVIFGNMLLKPLINRTRPYEAIGRSIIVNPLKDGSFPSGHTYAAFATAFSIYKYDKKLGAPFFAFAILMAFTRLYLFVHYPTDVIGGIVLGFICSAIGYKLTEKTEKYLKK